MTAQSIRIRLGYECERLEKIKEPITRAKQARALDRALADCRIRTSDITRLAVVEITEDFGWSRSEVGDVLGISRQRVQQIVDAA